MIFDPNYKEVDIKLVKEAIVFENGGFVGSLGLSKKNYGRSILKLVINIELILIK